MNNSIRNIWNKIKLLQAVDEKQNSSITNFKIAAAVYNATLGYTPLDDNCSVGEILMFVNIFYDLSFVHCFTNCKHPIYNLPYTTAEVMQILKDIQIKKGTTAHQLMEEGELILGAYLKFIGVNDKAIKLTVDQSADEIDKEALLTFHDVQKN